MERDRETYRHVWHYPQFGGMAQKYAVWMTFLNRGQSWARRAKNRDIKDTDTAKLRLFYVA